MSDKLKARPKYNRENKVWNIIIDKDGKEIPLGHYIGKSELFFERKEFDTKEDAIEHIKSVDKFEFKGEK